MKSQIEKKGFTLVEILVATAIATTAGILLVVIIVNSAGLFSLQSSEVQEGLNINNTLLKVKSSIQQASSVAVSYTDGLTVYTTGANQLVLKVVSIDSSNNIIADTYDSFVIFSSQNILHFKIFPDPASSRKLSDQIFSTSLNSLTFQYFNSANPPQEVAPTSATRVRISLTLKQKNGLNYEINIATSEANLRNG